MIRISFFLREDQIEYLKSIPGTISEHIRRAIDRYIRESKGFKVSASKSKGKGDE